MSTLGLQYHQVKWDFLDVLHHKTFSSGKSQLHFNAIFNLLNEVYIGFPATFWVPRKPPKAGVKNHPYKTYEPPHLALFEMKEQCLCSKLLSYLWRAVHTEVMQEATSSNLK